MASIEQLIQDNVDKFRTENGYWSPMPYGYRELIARGFLIMLRTLFLLDLSAVFPEAPEDFFENVKNNDGLFLKGGDLNSHNPSLQVNFPSGTLKSLQLGLGVPNHDRDVPDSVVKSKFSGSISFSSKGRTSLEAVSIADMVDNAFNSILSDCLGALSIKVGGMTASDLREEKKANDVQIWRADTVYSIDLPDLTQLFTLDYSIFKYLTLDITSS